MCTSEACVGGLVEVMSDALSAADAGRSAHQVVCAHLGGLMGGASAAYVRVDVARHTCTITGGTSSPGEVTVQLVPDELEYLYPYVNELPHLSDQACLTSSNSAAWLEGTGRTMLLERLGGRDMAHLPLWSSPDEFRLVALVRDVEFSVLDQKMLRRMQRPLAMLDAHVRRIDQHTNDPIRGIGTAGTGRTGVDVGLTRRELEVLRLLAQGLAATAIAGRLHVSPRTVHKHLGNLYRKLDSHDRLLTVTRAQALGLLPTAPPPLLTSTLDEAGQAF